MLVLGSKLRIDGHDKHVMAGLNIQADNGSRRMLTVRPIFDNTLPQTFNYGREDYKIYDVTLPVISNLCPAWHLLCSVSQYNRTMDDRVGRPDQKTWLHRPRGLMTKPLRLRGNSSVLGKIIATGKPIDISDWNNSPLTLTGCIQLEPFSGQSDIAGNIGAVFETMDGVPIGTLISRSKNYWYLAPILPFLESTNLSYCDPMEERRESFQQKLGNAPVLDLNIKKRAA
jgi:hypothetical protein